ncbi:MAG: hypothetical protein FWD17_11400, partial [Polyangiaceae bacterium]|nr:hypothetical protein [Polyangiaceae bacterium]
TQLTSDSPRSLFSDPTGVAWNGANFFLTYLGTGIEGSLIDPALGITAAGIPLSAVANQQSSPAVTWDGRNYLVSWIDERTPDPTVTSGRAVRISSAGQVLDPAGIAVSADAFSEGLASTGRQSAIEDWNTTTSGASFRLVGANGQLGPVTSITPSSETTPGLGISGNEYLIVFTPSSTANALSGELVNQNGIPGPSFPIVSGLDETHIIAGTVISGGQDFLVSYPSAGGTAIIPVSRAGEVGASVQLSSAPEFVQGATDGSRALVVWAYPSDPTVRAQFFARGAPQGDPLIISTTSSGFTASAVWDGVSFWVFWESPDASPLPMARPVRVDGSLGTAALVVNDVCESPSVASNGRGQILLACFQQSEGGRTLRITTRLLSDATAAP